MSAVRRLSTPEFVAMMAMAFATVAFSLDSMLPALPEIAGELSPGDVNRAGLVVTSFMLGLGLGTFFTGSLSDAFGRKPVILWGSALYVAAALMAWRASSLEMLLVARVLQGLGAAGPRVAGLAIVRDLYSGREMARITSFVMMVFTIVPAIAPLIGTGIIAVFGWRQIFLAFLVFNAIMVTWISLRQAETLPRAERRPIRLETIRAGLAELMGNRTVTLSIAVQTLCFGALLTHLTTIQPSFDVTFGRAEQFPLWFGGIAVLAASGSMINARLVQRVGMRTMIKTVLSVEIVICSVMILGTWAGVAPFPLFLVWTTSVFFMVGMTIGNLNALAMEPVGHIAGLAASTISALSTVGGAAMAAPLGLAFDGTPLPAAFGILAAVIVARVLTSRIERDSGA